VVKDLLNNGEILNQSTTKNAKSPKSSTPQCWTLKDENTGWLFRGIHGYIGIYNLRVNPDERPSNGLSEVSMKISQAQGFAPDGRSDIFILTTHDVFLMQKFK
jgi:hypothetical protein